MKISCSILVCIVSSRLVRVGANLAEQGTLAWSEVMSTLPIHYESAQFEAILQPTLQVSLLQVAKLRKQVYG